eukprot:scaffold283018_cov15-Tisochrysis_lutea.AAC.2
MQTLLPFSKKVFYFQHALVHTCSRAHSPEPAGWLILTPLSLALQSQPSNLSEAYASNSICFT